MTNDAKMTIKDFIAKSWQSGTQQPMELFYNLYETGDDIFENFDDNATIKCYKQVVSPNNTGIMWTIIALYSNTLHRGRLVIINEEFKIVATIEQYTSEVNIGCFYAIEMDEKGRLYGIEWFNEERVRFVMLNNIAIPKNNTYYAEIRTAYDVPTLDGHAPFQNINVKGFIKKNNSKYGFVLGWDYQDIMVYTFEIVVGGSNVWKGKFTANVLWKMNAPFIKYDSNNKFTFKCVGLEVDTTDFPLKYDIFTEGDNDITATTNMIFTTTNNKQVANDSDFTWVDENTILVPFRNSTYDTMALQTLDLTGSVFNLVYEETFSCFDLNVMFSTCNQELFMYALGVNDLDHGNNWKESVFHILRPSFDGLSDDENIFEYVLNDELGNAEYENVDMFIVQNQYDLYNHIIGRKVVQFGDTDFFVSIAQEIYTNGYNGAPFFSLNSLKPFTFVLWHYPESLTDKKKILLARDVYNVTSTGNVINTFLQIPNFLLNDTSINKVELWGYQKMAINIEEISVYKNEYEELILVINNKLNIYDNNDGNILRYDASCFDNVTLARLNNTAPTGIGCKMRVNYTDNTYEDIQTSVVKNGTTTTISIDLNVQKEVKNIEVIPLTSNGYKYADINYNFEIGKTYKISQDVRIGV